MNLVVGCVIASYRELMSHTSRIAIAIVVAAPSLVLAQPADALEPRDPAPASAPAPPPTASQPAPVAPGPTAPMPAPTPVNTLAPTRAAPYAFHSGMTFEANLGFGLIHVTSANSSGSVDTDTSLAGLDLGVGGWLDPNLALTLRLSSVDLRLGNTSGTVVAAFLGPSVQYWPNDNFWLGAGAGLATLAAIRGCSSDCTNTGLGLDLRMGYSFTSTTANTFDISLELTPGFDSNDGNGGGTATGVALLAGYQFL